MEAFKPFDKVLVRNRADYEWDADLYSYYKGETCKYPHRCISGDYVYCIPFEGNESLLGTTKSPDHEK